MIYNFFGEMKKKKKKFQFIKFIKFIVYFGFPKLHLHITYLYSNKILKLLTLNSFFYKVTSGSTLNKQILSNSTLTTTIKAGNVNITSNNSSNNHKIIFIDELVAEGPVVEEPVIEDLVVDNNNINNNLQMKQVHLLKMDKTLIVLYLINNLKKKKM